MIVRILTDHYRLNNHVGKLDVSTDTIYKFIYVLRKCPAFVQSSSRHLGEYLIPNAKSKHLEVGNINKFFSVVGLNDS